MSTTSSFFVQYKHNPMTGYTLLEIVEVDSVKKVHLRNGSFLVRIMVDEAAAVERCFIRHIASGREAYVQGGPSLRAFVQACLLDNGETEIRQQQDVDENGSTP